MVRVADSQFPGPGKKLWFATVPQNPYLIRPPNRLNFFSNAVNAIICPIHICLPHVSFL